jgi:hypothetical protein
VVVHIARGGLTLSERPRLFCGVLILIIFSPLLIMPLSTPMLSNVVIVMHEDEATNLTLATLRANIPNLQVISYGSPIYYLSIFRLMNPTLWLSHGTEEGILAGVDVISWRDFSRMVEMTPSNDVILACESSGINEYVDSGAALGFEGSIDARVAGFVGSIIVLSQNFGLMSGTVLRVLDGAFDLISNLITGALTLIPLGAIPSWWGIIKAALIGIITGIYFLAGETQLPTAAASWSHPALFLGILSFLVSLVGYIAYLVVGSFFPSVGVFINYMYLILGAAVGVILSLVLGGALPGLSYFILYIGGWLASLIGVQASWAAPWCRAAFAASAAIFIVSALDLLLFAYWTYYV